MLAQELVDLRALADIGAVAIAAVALALVGGETSPLLSTIRRFDSRWIRRQ